MQLLQPEELQARARALAVPLANAAADVTSVLVMHAGGGAFALPVDGVAQVLASPPVAPVPHAAPALSGIVSWHGDVLPVLDVGAALGHPPSPARFVVVVARGEARAGIVSAGRPLVHELSPDVLEAPPPAAATLVTGLFWHDGRPVRLLNVGALLTPNAVTLIQGAPPMPAAVPRTTPWHVETRS